MITFDVSDIEFKSEFIKGRYKILHNPVKSIKFEKVFNKLSGWDNGKEVDFYFYWGKRLPFLEWAKKVGKSNEEIVLYILENG